MLTHGEIQNDCKHMESLATPFPSNPKILVLECALVLRVTKDFYDKLDLLDEACVIGHYILPS